jgi:hypothetical protein
MSQYDEDRSVYNGHFELEVHIDRPVGEVWKQLVELGSWVTTHGIERLVGAWDAVGGIVRIYPKGLDDPKSLEGTGLPPLPPPHYHYGKLIKLVPERQHLMKAYEAPGGSYGLKIGAFEDYRLSCVDGKTRVVFNGYIEYSGPMIAKDPNYITVDSSREAMTKNLANLKRIVESR